MASQYAKIHANAASDNGQRPAFPNRSGYPLRPGNRPQALAFQAFELVVPEAAETDPIEVATMAGQLAVGQYATPHTREAASRAAVTVAGAINVEQVLTDDFVECLYEVAELSAREAVGDQYFRPHEKQAARAAAQSILIQQGYIEQGEQ